MIKQPKSSKVTGKLASYFYDISLQEFADHGYTDSSKEFSKRLIRDQLNTLKNEEELWYATELGQPFLYWDGTALDIGGVLNYNAQTQMGTFEHNTKAGKLKVENVHSYHIFPYIYDKWLPGHSYYLPEKDELSDIYLSAIVNEGDNFTLYIYHNTTCIFMRKNVFPEEYIEYTELSRYKDRLAYVRYATQHGTNYRNYVYDIRKEIEHQIDDSIKNPSFMINYGPDRSFEKASNYIHPVSTAENFITIYAHNDNSQAAVIMLESIKNEETFTMLPNLFEDDSSINFKVTLNDPEKIRFLYYCAKMNKEIYGTCIYELPINVYRQGSKNYRYEYKDVLSLPEHTVKYYKKIYYELCKKLNEKAEIDEFPEILYHICISSHDMICFMYQYLRDCAPKEYEAPWILSYMGNPQLQFDKEKNEYDRIFNKLAKEGKLNRKWKNEYTLYQMVQKAYPDALYQYHAEWLGRQSLDIFIPSLNIGIEYQGQQHYEPIDYFGGEETFLQNQERDERKRNLCKENHIKLIEWEYTAPVTSLVLKEKMADIS